MSLFFHEELHRSPPIMARLKSTAITLCGAGALGSNMAENLARTGCARLTVIDRDRIEERNLSTQPYYRSDIGAYKAKILSNALYRALGVAVTAQVKELTAENVQPLLQGSDLVIDGFDNSGSRQLVKTYCEETGCPGLHVGLAGDYAEVLWNPVYRVPSPANDDICDYPLARNLVTLTVAVACETVVRFIATGEQHSFTITWNDFAVRPFQA